MATYKTTGIVIRRHNLGEADRIITFLTPDHGKLRAVARGVRKIKSRMAGHLELFSDTELMLAEGRRLDVVASAQLKHFFAGVTADYQALSYAYLMAEIIDRLVDEGEGQPQLYGLVRDGLKQLEVGPAGRQIELTFKLRLADLLGYRPHLDSCVVCHQPLTTRIYFNPQLGGVVDGVCAGGTPLSWPALQLWQAIINRGAIGSREPEAAGSIAVCDQFYDHLFGRRFKSLSMLNRPQP